MSQKISRRQFLSMSAIAAAGAALAACAPKTPVAEEKPPAATTKPEVKATDTPKVEAKPVWPRGKVPRERTLIRMFGPSEYTFVGFGNLYATGASHQWSYASMLEAMFYYGALNDKTYSHLAESYEYNKDATELTVHLRKEVEWSDGTPFTAKDVAFTYNSLIKFAPALRDSARIKVLTKEVVAVDDFTVKFILNEPNWRYHFTECTYRMDRGIYIVPEHCFKDVEDWLTFKFGPSDNPNYPVVTGAWKLAEDTNTHKHFDLREDWWAIKSGFMKRPDVERVIQIGFTDDTKAAQMIINNEVDETLDLRPRTIKSILDQAPHVTTFSGREKPYGYVDWWPISMYFNTLEKPYTDPKVRWAIAYAVDQQQLVDIGWDGAGMVSAIPFPEYPGLMKYVDTIKDILQEYNPLEYNLNKSAKLMEEAGFKKDSEGFWVDAQGNRPDTDIWAGVPLFGDIAPVTAEQLRKAGFDSKHVTPPDVWAGKSDGRAKLHFFGHGGSVKDPFTTLDMYHIRNVKPTGQNCGDNRPRWGNEKYSAIVDELRTTPPDDPKTFKLFRAAMEIWYKELPEVPLVQWIHRTPFNTTYWEGWTSKADPYNTSMWHLTMPLTLWRLKAKK